MKWILKLIVLSLFLQSFQCSESNEVANAITSSQLETKKQEINNTKAKLTKLEKSSKKKIYIMDKTKLETKIIHKKQLENQLAKCINWAKYIQQRGFNNETARTSGS